MCLFWPKCVPAAVAVDPAPDCADVHPRVTAALLAVSGAGFTCRLSSVSAAEPTLLDTLRREPRPVCVRAWAQRDFQQVRYFPFIKYAPFFLWHYLRLTLVTGPLLFSHMVALANSVGVSLLFLIFWVIGCVLHVTKIVKVERLKSWWRWKFALPGLPSFPGIEPTIWIMQIALRFYEIDRSHAMCRMWNGLLGFSTEKKVNSGSQHLKASCFLIIVQESTTHNYMGRNFLSFMLS